MSERKPDKASKNNKSAKSTKSTEGRGLGSRRAAVEALLKVETESAFANTAIDGILKQRQLSERDRAFVTALVQGVLRNREAIDGLLRTLSSKPLEKTPKAILTILRVGIFQIDFMDGVPESAVVNTSTELARALGHSGTAKFTNAILRSHLRNKEKTICLPAGTNLENSTSVDYRTEMNLKYSVPTWLVERWIEVFGEAETKALLEDASKPPILILRVNEEGINATDMAKILNEKGMTVKQSLLVPSCLIVESRGKLRGPIEKIPGYTEGLFAIQDEAAALVSYIVAPQPGELILDLCAAPGGKSVHLAELMKGTGRVLAVDSSAIRLKLLRENRSRLEQTNLEMLEADGRNLTLPKPADRVLLDAPCTGTGVLRRKTDLRYNRKLEDLTSLVTLQRELLENAAKLTKNGGVLVYSTCSIEPEENLENFQWFLKNHSDFNPVSIESFFPPTWIESIRKSAERFGDFESNSKSGPVSTAKDGYVQLLPSRHQTSGFFICKFQKS